MRTRPGRETALTEIYWGTIDYDMRENKAPSSLKDLEGTTVLNSSGQKVLFSVKALEKELGTNASVIAYFPEFRALGFGQIPPRDILLAYVPDASDKSKCLAIFLDRGIHEATVFSLNSRVLSLRAALASLPSTNKPPAQF